MSSVAGSRRVKVRTLHIATVGKTAEPILEGLRALPCDRVALLHGRESKDTAESIRGKYGAFAGEGLVELREVDEFDFESVLLAALAIASEHEDHRVCINITGGTKIMAPAALLAGFILGADAIYVKEDKKREHSLDERVLRLPIPRVNLSALTIVHKRILVLLARYEDDGVPHQTARAFLLTKLETSGPTLTYHLRNLETHRLIATQRVGREQRVELTPAGRLYAKLIAGAGGVVAPSKARRRRR